jgi:hypothetical protein
MFSGRMDNLILGKLSGTHITVVMVVSIITSCGRALSVMSDEDFSLQQTLDGEATYPRTWRKHERRRQCIQLPHSKNGNFNNTLVGYGI